MPLAEMLPVPIAGRAAVLVVAGGASTRFPGDKLTPSTGLLADLFAGIPAEFVRILVGRPASAVPAGVDVAVPDEHPGGGPAAGIITGLQLLRSRGLDSQVVILPGDSPGSFVTIRPLLRALTGNAIPALAACSRDQTGAVSPMPAALSPAAVDQLLTWAGTGVGGSVRGLLRPLGPTSVPVPQSGLFDVDTAADLTGWRLRAHPDVIRLVALIESRRGRVGERPLVVALHGPPAGTAAMAAAVRSHLAVTVLDQEADVLDQESEGSGRGVRARRSSRRRDQAGPPGATGPAAIHDPAARVEVVLRLCSALPPSPQSTVDLSVLVQPESARTPARGFVPDLALRWPGCEPS